jgi:hypothetical protein
MLNDTIYNFIKKEDQYSKNDEDLKMTMLFNYYYLRKNMIRLILCVSDFIILLHRAPRRLMGSQLT